MATILPFLKDQSVFEPEMTQAMSIAFDEVCQALNLSDTAVRERETVAVRIIEWARRGAASAIRRGFASGCCATRALLRRCWSTTPKSGCRLRSRIPIPAA
jgi:hypothetical protein